jgi:hypothetical protein
LPTVGLATGPVGVTETVELVLELVELLLELKEVEPREVELRDAELGDVKEVEDTPDELEIPEEVDDGVTVELEETADLFCTVANVVPTRVALLLASMAL